jgi:hypothetical protein
MGVSPSLERIGLAKVGLGRVAYIKPMLSDEVRHHFPHAPYLAPGQQLFALHSANGVPLLVTDSLEAAQANALTQSLQTVSLH